MDYQTLKISHPLNLFVIPSRGFTLSDHQKLEVENVWRHEQAARANKLFNGQIFNLVEITEKQITGEFVPYKFYLAQRRNPALKELLFIRPMCISGITLAGNKILVGQRSKGVTQYPNFYETVPSGGIDDSSVVNDKVDLLRQFENELWEETGISVTEIKKIEIFALVHEPTVDEYEVCGEIQVNYTILRETLAPTEEYVNFQWLTKQELKKHLAAHADEYVPLTAQLLKIRHLL